MGLVSNKLTVLGKIGKGSSLVIAPIYNPGQQLFYNVGSGSSLAIVLRHKLAAAHCRH